MLKPASLDFVVAVTTHPRNWKWCMEDGADPATYVPPPRLYFAHGDQGYVGLDRLGRHTWAFHIAMLPKAKGVLEFVKMVMQAMVLIFDAKKFLGTIPADNKASIRLCRAAGAHQEGCMTKTFYRNGKLHDVLIYAINIE